MRFDSFGFVHEYSVDVRPEQLPGDEPKYFNLDRSALGGGGDPRIGVFRSVRVSHSGASWIGYFECETPGGLDEAAATPSPDSILVVSGGATYLLSVRDPDRYRQLNVGASMVVGFPGARRVVLLLERTLVGLGARGIEWEVCRDEWEELALVMRDAESMLIDVLEWTTGETRRVRVRVTDGRAEHE